MSHWENKYCTELTHFCTLFLSYNILRCVCACVCLVTYTNARLWSWWKTVRSLGEWSGCSTQDQRNSGSIPGRNRSLYLHLFSAARLVYGRFVMRRRRKPEPLEKTYAVRELPSLSETGQTGNRTRDLRDDSSLVLSTSTLWSRLMRTRRMRASHPRIRRKCCAHLPHNKDVTFGPLCNQK
jgi:hypothetical protein